MKRIQQTLLCGWLGLMLTATAAWAQQVPTVIYLQGQFLNANGTPAPGSHPVTIAVMT